MFMSNTNPSSSNLLMGVFTCADVEINQRARCSYRCKICFICKWPCREHKHKHKYSLIQQKVWFSTNFLTSFLTPRDPGRWWCTKMFEQSKEKQKKNIWGYVELLGRWQYVRKPSEYIFLSRDWNIAETDSWLKAWPHLYVDQPCFL